MDNGVLNSPKKKWRNKLSTTLFFWFMLLSLGPVIVIGTFEYQTGKKNIIDGHYKTLSTTNLLFSEQLNDFFDSLVTNLFIKSWTAQEFIESLVRSLNDGELKVEEYIKTKEYKLIVDKYTDEFIDFVDNNGFSNLIIGDDQGNILYTANQSNHIGKNLFTGSLKITELSKSAKVSMANYKPSYAAIDSYMKADNESVSFFIMPLINDYDVVSGFIAVQIFANKIQELFLRQGEILGNSANSYLINLDGKIVFGTTYSPELNLVVDRDNPLFKLWLSNVDPVTGNYIKNNNKSATENKDITLEENNNKNKLTQIYSNVRNYKNLDVQDVMGIYYPVSVGATPMAMISEVAHDQAFSSLYEFRNRLLWMSGTILLTVILFAILITRKLVKPINTITSWVKRVSSGDYIKGNILKGSNEIIELSNNFIGMTETLRSISNENEQRSWMQEGLAGLNDSLRGDIGMSDLCRRVVTYLCRYLDFHSGGMYVLSDDKTLYLMGDYAWHKNKRNDTKFQLGEGLVGQAALEKEIMEILDVPSDYFFIESGLGRSIPETILIVPFLYENEVKGVFEFGILRAPDKQKIKFIKLCIENVAIAINSVQYRSRVDHLLDKTTKQSEILKEQQEELKSVNEELEKRATILEASEEELKAQSEELQSSNAELEEKSEQLFQQKEQIEQKNRDIELSKKEVEEKAKQIEQSSKYKSEFLANMSHELRTPLNSLLLLSQMLAENDEGNLTEDQIESAKVIYNGGKELLELINDILDLSKVEAGKMSITLEAVDLQDLCIGIDKLLRPLAENKGLEFDVSIKPDTTKVILSDSQRLLQIIKNFLSNAFKFTEKGGVYVTVSRVVRKELYNKNSYINFSVKDTGIGIPKDKQAAIFEAFQQADGSTSRKYGGTGLGLAISKEFASLLGGFIEVESTENEGTTFSVLLPDNPVCSLGDEQVYADTYLSEKLETESETTDKSSLPSEPFEKESEEHIAKETLVLPDIKPGQPSLLLIEDDPNFINILGRIAEKYKFQYFHTAMGKQGITLAKKIKPDAIILDLGLPDMDGQAVLNQLKSDKLTKHIPVHIISGRDPGQETVEGIIGYLVKPVSITSLDKVFLTLENVIRSDIQDVLVLDEDEAERKNICSILAKKAIEYAEVSDTKSAEKMLHEKKWQCLVMDYELKGSSGIEFLKKMRASLGDAMPAVIIHTARTLTEKEYQALQQYTNTMVVKGRNSGSRVKDEVSLFLHSVQKPTHLEQTSNTQVLGNEEKLLENKKLLLVDDDLRNTFALSKVLQGMGMDIVIADNGKVALDKLDSEDGIELVLMDIMMPVMDGYETMQEIRKTRAHSELPIIALTAKAMREDREKCIDAGANDYMTKPIDMEKLVAMLKVWLLK
ncbi:MAG: response regulator [Endozoicomonas sp. (ex Botrylloides leachii)]|nr:response regulator [Endozoicomonas sp. (ex Botrylloides leachii)]